MIFANYGKLLGKITEYACCISLNTPFQGTYNGVYPPVYQLASRFSQNPLFINEFEGYIHTGHQCPITEKYHPPYDFIHPDSHQGLSVKSIMDNSLSKVSPSSIGQPSMKKFCEIFSLDNGDEPFLKYQIVEKINTMMPLYFQHTFQYPILYYHAKKDLCMIVKSKQQFQIPWYDFQYTFTHELKNKLWQESSSICIKKNKGVSKSLGEFQFHRHRNCIKFRFSLTNLLEEFPQHFIIQQW